MSEERASIRIIYKSGAEVTLTCRSFTTQRNGRGDLLGLKWEDAVPEPLFAGVNDIAAVWQLP